MTNRTRFVSMTMLICGITLAGTAWPAEEEAQVASTTASSTSPTSLKVYPYELPQSATYPHYLAVWIEPSWGPTNKWLLRTPETLASSIGLLFIDHFVPKDLHPEWTPVTTPKQPVHWQQTANGVWQYTCPLKNGVTLSAQVKPGKDDLMITYTVVNNTTYTLSVLNTQFCLVENGAPDFADRLAERTFILVNGEFVALNKTRPDPKDRLPGFVVTNTSDMPRKNEWQEDQADIPFIATVSKDGKRVIAKAFENAGKLMTNSGIPCIHADPVMPECKPGETVKVRGKIYFVEGSLQEALALFAEDFPDWVASQEQ